MEKRTISVVGCGWLGLEVGKLLLREGYRVKGSTTSPEKLAKLEGDGIQAVLYPGAEGERLNGLFRAKVLVLTFPPARKGKDTVDSYREQIARTVAHARAGEVRKLLFLSTTGVYGDQNATLTEAAPTDPTRATARALLSAEEYLREIFGGDLTILRLAGLAGPGRAPGRFLAGKKGLSGGETPVNFVQQEDAARAVLAVIRQAAWGEVFNVCADLHPSRNEFYPAKAREMGLPPPEFSSEGSLPEKIVSNQKIKAQLGFTFLHPDPMGF